MPASARSRAAVPSPEANAWIELAETELRQAGHRTSAPRSAVLEQMATQRCVLTAQEIADRLRERGRKVGIATVYRTLEVLEKLRLVQRLDLGSASARYEPALPGGEHHHHHLVCEHCGEVTPFDDPSIERAIAALSKRLDYRVGDHDVVLRGACPKCARA